MEFMLKMQVPEGKPKAGMVHHKIHDKAWTALGMPPHEDAQPRFLWPPSTAATLNLAATAAQCARIWRSSTRRSPTAAWRRRRRPGRRRSRTRRSSPARRRIGGGPYDDKDVSDEFYWAAAELYATTKKDAYKAALEKSPHYKKVLMVDGDDRLPTSMTWGAVGRARDDHAGDGAERAAREGDRRLQGGDQGGGRQLRRDRRHAGLPRAVQAGQEGLPVGFELVRAQQRDHHRAGVRQTGDAKYVNAVAEGMNYILGRNPLDKSYVTGYGERPLQNPHHRFWAHQANAKFPSPPAGVVSGGPNSGLQDPYVQAAGLAGCAPQKCFVDNIEAWSANEMAINWNTPLAWVAAFLDEKGSGKGAGKAKGKK